MTVHTIRQGEDCELVVSGIKDADGDPLDCTGMTITAHARPAATSATLWQEWTTTAGTATGGVGTVTLTISAAVSTAWTWGGQVGVVHIEIAEPAGLQRRHRVASERIYLDPEAVR